VERVGALGGGRCPGADDGGDVAGAVGRDVGQGRGPVRAQRVEEAGDGFHGAAGSGPDKQAGVMIDDDDHSVESGLSLLSVFVLQRTDDRRMTLPLGQTQSSNEEEGGGRKRSVCPLSAVARSRSVA
jgi:hypothetical protein